MQPELSLFPVEFLTALAKAAAAIARAEERLAHLPERDLLVARIRMEEREALAWLEGEPFNLDQLTRDYGTGPRAWRHWPFTFVRVFERPLASRTLPDAARIERWLNGACLPAGPFPTPADQPLELYPERLQRFLRGIDGIAPLPRLVGAGHIAAEFPLASPLPYANTVIGAMLAERYALPTSALTGGGIAAIGLYREHIPWRSRVAYSHQEGEEDLCSAGRDTRVQFAWLRALRAGAERTAELGTALRIWLQRLDAHCLTVRKTSHLRALCLLAARSPSLTVAGAARTLKVSRQSTTDLIARACDAGLLREVTENGSFRRFKANLPL